METEVHGPFRWKPRFTDHSDGNRDQRTTQMETETNGPFRWIPRTRMSKNDCKFVRILPFPTSTITYTVNHITNPQHSAFPHSQRLAPPNPLITIPGPPSVPLGYPGPHPTSLTPSTISQTSRTQHSLIHIDSHHQTHQLLSPGHPLCPSATQVPIHPRRRMVCVCVGECGSRARPT